MTFRTTFSAVAILVAASTTSVSATTVTSCSSSSVAVSNTSDCQLGSVHNDVLNPLQVNNDKLFGFDDWIYLAKDDGLDGTDEGPFPGALTISGGTLGGTWLINQPPVYGTYMLVFKGGASDNTAPNVYVGYLVSRLSGDYKSPFTNTNNDNSKGISHVTLYAREPSPVPLPAAGWLLLAGVGGLAAIRRRTHKAAGS